MKVRSLVVALIYVAAGSGASFAFAGTSFTSDDDSAAVFGSVKLSNLQDIGGSAKLAAPPATVGMDALRGASGNLGVNLAAGALNAQANEIAVIGTPRAEISTQQNVHAVAQLNGSASAQLGAHALAGVSGNVGVNIAAGAGNAQFNGLVVH
ncbi:hypothetical protein [Paraburkholderia sp. BL21I4N1]|uniref:hypothetical protein n=1 Tax=Paraburkholderia sp. BL21I4N1 TaxID=1938801 RepID=UPI000CFB26DC|nr:hypothetical protein [Paraburkholderia sp. BL21I4N1]PQV52164.1 hypothetical protein B0G83_104384 [Paraburkholderia sp. BL21I4N1]